jgi:hypothetical protein
MGNTAHASVQRVLLPPRGTARIIPFRVPTPVGAAATPPKSAPGPLRPPLAIIRRPARSVVQGGRRDPGWILEFEPAERPLPDPLMGWSGSGDVHSQIRIPFPDRALAERFARRNGLRFIVVPPAEPATTGVRPALDGVHWLPNSECRRAPTWGPAT